MPPHHGTLICGFALPNACGKLSAYFLSDRCLHLQETLFSLCTRVFFRMEELLSSNYAAHANLSRFLPHFSCVCLAVCHNGIAPLTSDCGA